MGCLRGVKPLFTSKGRRAGIDKIGMGKNSLGEGWKDPPQNIDKEGVLWYDFLYSKSYLNNWIVEGRFFNLQRLVLYGEFDPGSGLTLAACLMHASRTSHFGG
jgi:hypothetical protein